MSTDMLVRLFSAVLWLSFQASVLVACVLALQGLLGARLSPRWRSALWLLVIARLLLPVAPQSTHSVFNWLSASQWEVAPVELAEAPAPATMVSAEAFTRSPHLAEWSPPVALVTYTAETDTVSAPWKRPDGWLLASGVWIAVGGLLFGSVLLRSLLLGRRIRALARIEQSEVLALFASCASEMSITRKIVLREAPARMSPAVCGVFRPVLLLPSSLLAESRRKELRHVLLHELAHVKRWDVAMNWLHLALASVHWFNPLLWFAFRRMRQDRELACDALATQHATEDEARHYAETLVFLLEQQRPALLLPVQVGIFESSTGLKRRITMIIASRRRYSQWLPLLAVVVLAYVGLTDAKAQDPEQPAEPAAPPAAATITTVEARVIPVPPSEPAPPSGTDSVVVPTLVTAAPPSEPEGLPAAPDATAPLPIEPVGQAPLNPVLPPPVSSALPQSPAQPAAPQAPGQLPPIHGGIAGGSTGFGGGGAVGGGFGGGGVGSAAFGGGGGFGGGPGFGGGGVGQPIFGGGFGPPPFSSGVAMHEEGDETIEKTLDLPVSIEFEDVDLREVLDFIAEQYGMNFVVDTRTVPHLAPGAKAEAFSPVDLEEAGLNSTYIARISLKDVKLASALDGLLRPLGLDYAIRPGFIWVSSPRLLKAEGMRARLGTLDASLEANSTLSKGLNAASMERKGEEKVLVRMHRVEKGEDLAGIAKEYGVREEAIMGMNELKKDRSLKEGQLLKILLIEEGQSDSQATPPQSGLQDPSARQGPGISQLPASPSGNVLQAPGESALPGTSSDSLPPQSMADKLKVPVSFEFERVHLNEIAEFLSKQFEINILLDQRVIEPAKGEIRQPGVTPMAYVSDGMVPFIRLKEVPLGEGLHVMLRPLKLDFRQEAGFLWVSTPEHLANESFEENTRRTEEGSEAKEDATSGGPQESRTELESPSETTSGASLSIGDPWSSEALPSYTLASAPEAGPLRRTASQTEVGSEESALETETSEGLDSTIGGLFGGRSHLSELVKYWNEHFGVNIRLDSTVIAPGPGTRAATESKASTYVTDGFIDELDLHSVTLREALHAILPPLGLTFREESDSIWVSTPEKIGTQASAAYITRTYKLPDHVGTTQKELGGFARAFFTAVPPVTDDSTEAFLDCFPDARVIAARHTPRRLDAAAKQFGLVETAEPEETLRQGFIRFSPKYRDGGLAGVKTSRL